MRFAIVAVLACQQYLAISLIYAAIPVILRRQGAPLEVVGLFGMVFFAFTVNFLWAPVVDRHPLTRLGRRRSWILLMQLLAAAAVAAAAGFDPARDHLAILAISVVLAALAATQRIATLGYVAEILRDDERSVGAAVMGWGGALGNVIGGAICLYLVERLGWRPALLAFALLMLGLAACVTAMSEPAKADAVAPPFPLLRTCRRRDIWRAIAIVTPATFGVAVAFAMIQPRLVDLGFGLASIGATVAAAHLLAFSVVGPVAGVLARRTAPLRALSAGGLLLTPGFVLLAVADGRWDVERSALAAVLFVFCALAVQNIAFTTFFLSLAGTGQAATDVTFLTAAMSVLALLGFLASGFIAHAFGYAATLMTAAGGYAATAALAALSPAASAR
jgi:MFS family permease